MFTGIVQGVATIAALSDREGLRSFTLALPPAFSEGLEVGASVACDGVCLTATQVRPDDHASFDVMQQSLALTTLGQLQVGDRLNVERAAKGSAEIGGHLISGHVDCQAQVLDVRQPANNHVIRLGVPLPWMRYIFAKGYVAINGASLTVSDIHRREGWFEVWLIPETLRVTTWADKTAGSWVNIEIDRTTQVVVDTVRDVLDERLGPLMPAIERLLQGQGQGPLLDALGVSLPKMA